MEQGAEAARSLPAALKLVDLLNDFADVAVHEEPEETAEGHFTIARVQGDRIWLQDFLEGGGMGPFALPSHVSARCRIGWRISGMVGRVGGQWVICEVWNVYPM